MLNGTPRSIEDFIFKYLQTGPLPMVALIERIKKDRPQTTKQGVYSALRGLKEKNIIVTHGKKASLNSSWFNTMSDYFSRVQLHYTETRGTHSDFLALKNGERITYRFQDSVATDNFWGHAHNLLLEVLPSSNPLFIYDPHYWFMVARPETERPLVNFILSKGHHYYMLVGGKTQLDKAIGKEFDQKQSHYAMLEKPLFKKTNYYLSFIGDFIFEAWFDKDVATVIDHLYETETNLDTAHEKLQKAVAYRGKSRFVISRDKRKAEKLKKMFGKYFVLTAK